MSSQEFTNEDQQKKSSLLNDANAEQATSFSDTKQEEFSPADGTDGMIALPLLGRRPVGQHQRFLYTVLIVALAGLLILGWYTFLQSRDASQQINSLGQSLTESQRVAKSVSQALLGNEQAFKELSGSSEELARIVRGLSEQDETSVPILGAEFRSDLDTINPIVKRTNDNAKIILGQRAVLTQVGQALQAINRQSADLLEVAETIVSLKLQQNSPSSEVLAASNLVMLTQRIGKSANEFQSAEGVSSDAVFLLGKDLNTFRELTGGLLKGSSELRLHAAKDPQMIEHLESLIKLYEKTQADASAILNNLQGLVAARESQGVILADSEPLRIALDALHTHLTERGVVGWGFGSSLVVFLLLVIFALVMLARVQLLDSQNRQIQAERMGQEALRQEQEAKRINDANQAAILRLMNELQNVAEGDLTQEATVTEDITGAIADSVNYTVEELRVLVGNVQNMASLVAQTSSRVDGTSTELLAASTEQLREIRDTGRSVLDLAERINEVSAQARESADVARQSREAADSGLQAVQNAIGGMNSIRDQIQETSKRIKRLGESSQEIGEITELISDITEQTNVLALNAAIQAASAGEAGRGFSVVAEEVQRLAERSADATKQIAVLVKTIQTDTQDAVGAMERSTQGVVEGARLSDSAGTALAEIDAVSSRLSELIEKISESATQEAELATSVADNIQHIFAVTEQTGEGTRATAQQVRELSRLAEDLRQSVARFRID